MTATAINHVFVDDKHIISAFADPSNDHRWIEAPIGALIIQEFQDSTAIVYYKITETGNTSDDWFRIGNSDWALHMLPVTPSVRGQFLLIAGRTG